MLPAGTSIRVAILGPPTLFHEGLREILCQREGLEVLDMPPSLEEALIWAGKSEPDIVLYHASTTPSEILEAASKLKMACRAKLIVLLRDMGEEFVIRCVRRGVDGFVLTTASPRELIQAIYATCGGELWLSRRLCTQIIRRIPWVGAQPISGEARLTRRERQIVELVSRGMTNKGVAEELLISETTVKAHLNDVFKKLGVRHRLQLLTHFAQNPPAVM